MHKKISEQEILLWKQYNTSATIKNRNKLMEFHYPLVRKIAYKLATKIKWKISPEELQSLGVDGLIAAISKFDIDKDYQFHTFATQRIHGSMIDNIRKLDMVPRSVRIHSKNFEDTKQKLESEKGGYVDIYEVIEEMGVTIDYYNKNTSSFHPTSFSSLQGSDMSTDGDNDMFKQDFNSALVMDAPDYIENREFTETIYQIKNILSNDKYLEEIFDKRIMRGMTMTMTANEMGISESRVSQLWNRCIVPVLKDNCEIVVGYKFEEHHMYKQSATFCKKYK